MIFNSQSCASADRVGVGVPALTSKTRSGGDIRGLVRAPGPCAVPWTGRLVAAVCETLCTLVFLLHGFECHRFKSCPWKQLLTAKTHYVGLL